VLKALALGARGCLVGKAFLYALAAMGQTGVTTALEIIRNELQISLALTGCNDVQAVGPEVLRGSARGSNHRPQVMTLTAEQ